MPRLSASRSIAALRAVPPSLSVPLTPSGARIDRVKYFGITHPPGRTTDPAAHSLDELTQWRRFCQLVLDRLTSSPSPSTGCRRVIPSSATVRAQPRVLFGAE